MNSTLKFIILSIKKANNTLWICTLLLLSNNAICQFSAQINLGKSYYSTNGIFSRFNYQSGNANGKDFLQIYQNNMFAISSKLEYESNKNKISIGIERNSITFNKQPFQRNGQMTRSFWFSVLSIGAGRSWILSQPDSRRIKLNLNLYAFTLLNKESVANNSLLYFNPPSHLTYDDFNRESFSIGDKLNVGCGFDTRIYVYPKLKKQNLSYFIEADVSLTSYFQFAWHWEEPGSTIKSTDRLDVHKRSISIGICYNLNNTD